MQNCNSPLNPAQHDQGATPGDIPDVAEYWSALRKGVCLLRSLCPNMIVPCDARQSGLVFE
jgi:hypothetical protein